MSVFVLFVSTLPTFFPCLYGLVTLQPALRFIWNRSPTPALANQRVEIILAEYLPMFHADECLGFTRLMRLLKELQNLHCDLAGGLAGRQKFAFSGLFHEFKMERQDIAAEPRKYSP